MDTKTLNQILAIAFEKRVSDVHFEVDNPPFFRGRGQLIRSKLANLAPADTEFIAARIMEQNKRKLPEDLTELDASYSLANGGRFRVSIFRQRGHIGIVMRVIPPQIGTFQDLHLPAVLGEIVKAPNGLILVTGPTGNGKSTTLASMLRYLNETQSYNIITIEDPIEYLHRHKSSNVNQREVGLDTDSFHVGLRHVLREAPDVIVIGEMRDPESFAIALQAADTGHLVLSCLHSNNAILAINRIIDIFPPEQQRQVRVQLADNLQLILNQRLVSRKDGKGRILAYEKLTSSYRIKNLIREGKEHHIRSLLQQAMDDFQSLDVSLARLCQEGKITAEAARHYCQDEAFFKDLLRKGRGSGTQGSVPEREPAVTKPG